MSASAFMGLALSLVFFALLVAVQASRPVLPGRPFDLLLLVPVAVMVVGAFMLRRCCDVDSSLFGGVDFRAHCERLSHLGVVVFLLAPFFCWQFRVYENTYMLLCGLFAVLAFIAFLVQLMRTEELFLSSFGRSRLAWFTRLIAVALPPFAGTPLVAIYLNLFYRAGAGWSGSVFASPYLLWLRLPGWIRFLPVATYACACFPTIAVAVIFFNRKQEE